MAKIELPFSPYNIKNQQVYSPPKGGGGKKQNGHCSSKFILYKSDTETQIQS